MDYIEVATADLRPGTNARGTVESLSVDDLVVSIGRLGMTHPPLVRRHGEELHIVDGHRRYAAATKLNLDRLFVLVVDCNEAESKLIGIEPQLAHRGFVNGGLARALARWKAEYEIQHPATKLGATGGKRAKKDDVERYTLIAAGLTGLNERGVQRLVRIGERAHDDVLREWDRGNVSATEVHRLIVEPKDKQPDLLQGVVDANAIKDPPVASAAERYLKCGRAFVRNFDKLLDCAKVVDQEHAEQLVGDFRALRDVLDGKLSELTRKSPTLAADDTEEAAETQSITPIEQAVDVPSAVGAERDAAVA